MRDRNVDPTKKDDLAESSDLSFFMPELDHCGAGAGEGGVLAGHSGQDQHKTRKCRN